MPTYITADDVYDYGLYVLTSSELPTATVNQFIDDAEAEVNGKCAKLYNVPFTTTGIPPLIAKVTRDLTSCELLKFLHQQRNRNINFNTKELCDDTEKLLEDIYNDKIRLTASLAAGGIGVITPNSASNLKGTYTDIPPIINVDDKYSWIVPGKLLDDIESRRSAAE